MKKNQALTVVRLVVGRLSTNCYIIHRKDDVESVIIDPGDEADYIASTITRMNLNPKAIVATHGHFDHILAAGILQDMFKIPFFIHSKDRFLLERMGKTAEYFLGMEVMEYPPRDIQLLTKDDSCFGKICMKPIHTPGHTPGSISLYLRSESCIFSGDLLFSGGLYGRTDFSYSNNEDLMSSIATIIHLPGTTQIYTGHADSTTVRSEKTYYSNGSINKNSVTSSISI